MIKYLANMINFFWTDALRNESSADWYWETSQNIISANDFYWGFGEPSLPNATVRSCINFGYYSGGYDDEDCLRYLHNVMCQ